MTIVMTSSHQRDKWRNWGVLGTGDLAWLGGQRGLPGEVNVKCKSLWDGGILKKNAP